MSPIILAAIITGSVLILVEVIKALISRRTQKASNKLDEGRQIYWIGYAVCPLSEDARITPQNLDEHSFAHIQPIVFAPTIKSEDQRIIEEMLRNMEETLRNMRLSLLEASSTSELEQVFFRVEDFLAKHSNHEEGLFLRARVVEALNKELSKQAKIRTYLQLLLYLFVLVRFWIFHRRRNVITNPHRSSCNSIYNLCMA